MNLFSFPSISKMDGVIVDVPGRRVSYQTHVQNVGWQGYVSDGNMSGTEGRGLRLEGIKIKLAGDVSKHFDVYYCVHAQNIGWMNWAKNGESAGSAGFGYRLEGIRIQLVRKGSPAPAPIAGSNGNAFVNK